MSRLLVFTGQGSFSKQKFLSLVDTDFGKQLFAKYCKESPRAGEYLKQISADGKPFSDVESTLATFYCNDYFSRIHHLTPQNVDYFAFYSAGYFNLLHFLHLVKLPNVLDAIMGRSLLLSHYHATAKMYMMVSNHPQQALAVNPRVAYLSIAFSPSVDTVAITDPAKFNQQCRVHHIIARLIPIHMATPYHTSLLDAYETRYRKIIKKCMPIRPEEGREYHIFRNGTGTLLTEALTKLNHPFSWYKITQKIVNHHFDEIIDTSPNHFLLHSIQKMKRYRRFHDNKEN